MIVRVLMMSCVLLCVSCKSAPTPNIDPVSQVPGDEVSSPGDTTPRQDIYTEPALQDAPRAQVSALPIMPLVPVASEERYSFGAGEQGFVVWASASGRLVVLMRFEDTNADGVISPEFGQHGEALQDAPSPYLVDVHTGQMTRVAEVLTWDSSSRYVAVRPQQESTAVEVWDAEAMTRVTIDESWGFSLEPDANACLRPRQVHLSPDGMIWGIRADERGVHGRQFDGSKEVQIDVGARVWRVEPAALNWLSIMYVEEDTDRSGTLDLPAQQTSCACRFCGRFALSMGVYGWRGDAWRLKLASPTGVISGARGGFALPLTSGVFVDAASEELLSWPEERALKREVPQGCARAPWLVGESPRVVLECEGGRVVLWEPSLPTPSLTLPVTLVASTSQEVARSAAGTHWFGAIVKGAEGETRHARVRLEDGYVELSSRSHERTPVTRVNRFGAMEVVAGEEVSVLEIASGRAWAGEVKPDHRVVFSTQGAAMQWPTSATGVYDLPGGCVLTHSGEESRVEQGPWRVMCVQAELMQTDVSQEQR